MCWFLSFFINIYSGGTPYNTHIQREGQSKKIVLQPNIDLYYFLIFIYLNGTAYKFKLTYPPASEASSLSKTSFLGSAFLKVHLFDCEKYN